MYIINVNVPNVIVHLLCICIFIITSLLYCMLHNITLYQPMYSNPEKILFSHIVTDQLIKMQSNPSLMPVPVEMVLLVQIQYIIYMQCCLYTYRFGCTKINALAFLPIKLITVSTNDKCPPIRHKYTLDSTLLKYRNLNLQVW